MGRNWIEAEVQEELRKISTRVKGGQCLLFCVFWGITGRAYRLLLALCWDGVSLFLMIPGEVHAILETEPSETMYSATCIFSLAWQQCPFNTMVQQIFTIPTGTDNFLGLSIRNIMWAAKVILHVTVVSFLAFFMILGHTWQSRWDSSHMGCWT